MSELRRIKRALISVSDKSGLEELARGLLRYDVEVISTGGTAKALREMGVSVTDVSEVTGYPEMMDGRVKTLHPKIHGAFLALRDNAEHVAAMRQHEIEPIDLVVVNLYPFENTVAKPDVSLAEAVENIDIGGPAMIRSSAKNWRDVAVVTEPSTYSQVLEEMNANAGSLSLETRQRLALAAFGRTGMYDLAISSYLAKQIAEANFAETLVTEHSTPVIRLEQTEFTFELPYFPSQIGVDLEKAVDLRYGENPHQKGALYINSLGAGVANAEQLNGKEMSFNNYVDAEAAWNLGQDFEERAVAIIKHTNPSGVGVGRTNDEAYRRALSADPVSAFGGIVAFNRRVDREAAESVTEIFSEVIVAPEYDPDALDVLRRKKDLRVLRVKNPVLHPEAKLFSFRELTGGFLIQDKDEHWLTVSDLQYVTENRPSADQIRALLLAWRVCKHVKSNAIVLANGVQTIGVGAGQMNRVDSIRIAAMRAERYNLPIKGSVLASDAFFPFRDNVDEAAKLGISAIIQPGGSVRDEETTDAANEHGLAMVFTGIRHFKH